jgi:hypothetical protein
MASRRRSRRQATSRRAEPRPVRLPHYRADGQPKTRFGSEQDANRAAFSYRLDHGVDLAAYACDTCGGWHLGNSPDG